MGQKFLIDTNVIIDFSENRLPTKAKLFIAELIDEEPFISIITKIELLGFSDVKQEIIEFTDIASIIGLTDSVANQTIALRKIQKIKLPDAVIAATAQIYHLTIVSRNTKDFENIPNLQMINPYNM